MSTVAVISFFVGLTVLILGCFYAIFRRVRQTANPPGGTNQPGNPPPATPTPPPTPKAKKRYGWLWWPVILVMAVILTWGFSTSWGKGAAATNPVVSSGMQTVQPKEEWVFSQVEESGRKRTFEVEITKQEPGLLYFIVQQTYNGRKTNIGGLRLNSSGDDWTGTWINYLDQDHGEANLYKIANNVWSGHYKLQDNSKVDCTLKRK